MKKLVYFLACSIVLVVVAKFCHDKSPGWVAITFIACVILGRRLSKTPSIKT